MDTETFMSLNTEIKLWRMIEVLMMLKLMRFGHPLMLLKRVLVVRHHRRTRHHRPMC